MDVKIYPGKLNGDITPPPSKSYLHRAIICASLAKGKSKIKNILIGDDIQQTIEAFRSLGVSIDYIDNQLIIKSSGQLKFQDNHQIQCEESGSTTRFLMPLLTNPNGVEFHGKPSLLKRPLDVYEKIYADQNNEFVRFNDYIYLQGQLKADQYVINDDSSSQYISGLLFALPLLDASSSLTIKKDFESKKYIDMTIHMLSQFGIVIHQTNDNVYHIPGKQVYQPADVYIESDYSQAAFFMVGAALNGHINFHKINKDSLQPDQAILNIIENAGGQVIYNKNQMTIKSHDLMIGQIDLSQTIDLGPILFILASQSEKATHVSKFHRLVYKESNRLNNMLDVLKRMQVDVQSNDALIVIGHQKDFSFNHISSYDDHRIAMALAIAATMAQEPTVIHHMEVINKSYPTFLNDLKNLGIKIEYIS